MKSGSSRRQSGNLVVMFTSRRGSTGRTQNDIDHLSILIIRRSILVVPLVVLAEIATRQGFVYFGAVHCQSLRLVADGSETETDVLKGANEALRMRAEVLTDTLSMTSLVAPIYAH